MCANPDLWPGQPGGSQISAMDLSGFVLGQFALRDERGSILRRDQYRPLSWGVSRLLFGTMAIGSFRHTSAPTTRKPPCTGYTARDRASPTRPVSPPKSVPDSERRDWTFPWLDLLEQALASLPASTRLMLVCVASSMPGVLVHPNSGAAKSCARSQEDQCVAIK